MVCQAIEYSEVGSLEEKPILIAGSSELTGDDQAITTSWYLEDIHDITNIYIYVYIYMYIYIYIFVYTQLHNVYVYIIYIYVLIIYWYILPQKRGFLDSAQLCRSFPRATFSCQTTGFGLRHGPTGERFQPSRELADWKCQSKSKVACVFVWK